MKCLTEWNRRFLLGALFVLWGLCLNPQIEAVADVGKDAHIISLARDGSLEQPVIVTDKGEKIYVAWQSGSGTEETARIHMAASPHWQAEMVAERPDLMRQTAWPTEIAAQPGDSPYLTWKDSTEESERYCTYDLLAVQTLTYTLQAERPWTATLTENGKPYFASGTSAAISVWSQGISPTHLSTLSAPPKEIALATSPQGEIGLAWSESRSDSATATIHYASILTGSQPITLSTKGVDLSFVQDQMGIAHLAWQEAEGLIYANSRNWDNPTLIADAPLAAPYALALDDSGLAHMAWIADGVVWYACAIDWRASQRAILMDGEPLDLALAVDSDAHPHIACLAESGDGTREILYIDPEPRKPQIGITYPRTGDQVDGSYPATAVSKQGSGNIVRVSFYLQEEAPCANEHGPWEQIGVDRDGSDGWAVDLPLADLDASKRYRLMALATNVDGDTPRAIGGWFRVQPQDRPFVWLYPPPVDPIRGKSALLAIVGGLSQRDLDLDLYLTPATNNQLVEPGKEILRLDAEYGGHYDLRATPSRRLARWYRLPIDSSQIPDGEYVIQAMLGGEAASDRIRVQSNDSLTIDNSMRPNITAVGTRPESQPINDQFTAFATANDPDGKIVQVDFFLQYAPSNQNALDDHEGQLLWLGSDNEAIDGWELTFAVDPAWRGMDWYVWAVAKDDKGLTQRRRSAAPIAIASDLASALQIEVPSDHLQGAVPITVTREADTRPLQKLHILIRNASGEEERLAEITAPKNPVTITWQTTRGPNGEYELLAIGECTGARQIWAETDRLTVYNPPPNWRLATPGPEAVLTGTIEIAADWSAASAPPAAATFYAQDERERLYDLGRDDRSEDGLKAFWRTTDYVDGEYEIVASFEDTIGGIFEARQSVQVRNETPSIQLGQATKKSYSGLERISWSARHPLGKPISVTISYSPDDGERWLTVASDLPADQSFLWDTATCPDSDKGRLRLVAHDGTNLARIESATFSLQNSNNPPHITIVRPQANERLAQEEDVIWQAWDNDGDTISIDLYYRGTEAEWQPIALDLPQEGRYTWQPPSARQGISYTLRGLAHDENGAQGIDLVSGLQPTGNTPPTARLVWPHGDATLEKEAVILWNATDADDDPLTIDLYYSDNAGAAWYPLAEGLTNSGYYHWQLSLLPQGDRYRLRLEACDGESTIWTESSEPFRIGAAQEPRIRLISPRADQPLSGIVPIVWSTSDSGDQAPLLHLSGRSPGEGWRTIAQGLPATGRYMWDTENWPDGPLELRLFSALTYRPADSAAGLYNIANQGRDGPRVTLLAPTGGEIWQGLATIRWRVDSPAEELTATLQLLDPKTEGWRELAVVPAQRGRFVWDTNEATSGPGYRLRILVSDGERQATGLGDGSFSIANHMVYPPSVTWVSEVVQNSDAADQRYISWIAEDGDGDALLSSLSYSEDGGISHHTIQTTTATTGRFDCGAFLRPNQPYRLRLLTQDSTYLVQKETDLLICAASRAPGGSIEWIAPLRDASLDDTVAIEWRTHALDTEDVAIDASYSSDGGLSWQPLARDLQGRQRYEWDTTALPNGTYRIRLRATSERMGTLRTSSPPLSIANDGGHAPVVSLLSPTPSQTLSGTRDVQWHAHDPDGDELSIDLDFRVGQKGSWQRLARNVPNIGHYFWDTLGVMDNDDTWLRITTTDGAFVGKQVLPAPIAIRNQGGPQIRLAEAPSDKSGIRLVWDTLWPNQTAVNVSLEYWHPDEEGWQNLQSSLPASGQIDWNDPPPLFGSPILVRATAETRMHVSRDEIVVCCPSVRRIEDAATGVW